ncbi:protein transporter SEC24 [Kwoniella mangroviensis CBS 10435]|uniref:Protein transporter SEC24 n=1 Tax=Kwoniella mangroviensis CBS 10435 TaxID=1331196 RepID=A0A1B9ILK3_9TREE|nr:protein transporter SEC24 [Kwoniella mangroviensis CBS 10435]OCF79009.1 protein transporter SEC24 [Kwoniella mangroviensis CBS 8886]
MPPRSRYAVDPSLTGGPQPPPQGPNLGYQQQQQQQQWQGQSTSPQPDYYQQQQQQHLQGQVGYDPNYVPQLHHVSDRPAPIPTGEYAPTHAPGPAQSSSYHHQQPQPQQYQVPVPQQPLNHIPPPPHSSGPTLTGPRVRIDPSQVPNPVEAQELDQNLYDDEDFFTCQTRGLVPLVGTDYRGIDQGNSLPRHLRATLPVIPSTSQLLDTTALPFGLIIQPFAQLRYDENPIPTVSNWISGQNGPPRCEKCRAYINPWCKFVDGGRKWNCNLCGANNIVSPTYFCHLSPSGQRLDHSERPELQFGTCDYVVGRSYWALQPPPSGSLMDVAVDAGNSASDAISSTAHDLLGGLQASLGQEQTSSSSTNYREKEKERKRELAKYRRPQGLARVFVIDVSKPSAERGIVREVCEGIRKALYGEKKVDGNQDEDEDEVKIGKGERIGIVSCAENVGFWNLSSSLSSPSQMIVSDLDDMFVPFTTGFLVDPIESRTQIEAVLDLLPTIAERGGEGNRVAAGSAVKGALAGLRMQGGQINLFLSGLVTHGAGALTSREDPTIYNTDKEKSLFSPSNSFWRDLSEELAECGVGINTFIFPEVYCDVASIGALSAVSGGEVFFHPKFQPVRDRTLLHQEIQSTITRETVYNVTVRIRCSNGLRVSDHLGNFYQRSMTDLEFATLDSGKSFVGVMKHEGSRLDDRQPAYVQVAILYTTSQGERKVRLLNMNFSVTSLIGNVFKFADQEAGVGVLLKGAVSQMPTRSLRDIKKALTERCNRVLLMYRKHCAPAVQQGQLILPEGFKLLPLYTLCMLKSKPLKGGNVTSDVRVHYMRQFKSLSATRTINLLYPKLLAIHDLNESVGFPDDKGKLVLPTFMRASYGWMVAEGAYLLSNGEVAMLWFGSAVNPQIIDDLYGVDNLQDLDVRMTQLPKLPTLLSTQLRNILTHLERILDHTLPVIIVRQNMDGMEIEFANQLVEDSNNDALSYTDYLMTAHKSITNELSGNGGKSDSWKPW